MGNGSSGFAGELRREICARNAVLSDKNGLIHVRSYGAVPVTVYAPSTNGRHHGNFFTPSYRAILKRKEWARRLEKIHSQGRSSLPQAERRWRELDSCTSSDALLMNIFCCPTVCGSKPIAGMLGTETGDIPEFGYRARVPLKTRTATDGTLLPSGKSPKPRFDRTEIDMRLGRLLVESKLTENDFQTAPAAFVTDYQDLEQVFDLESLPRPGECFVSYQLIRSVLAAHYFPFNGDTKVSINTIVQ